MSTIAVITPTYRLDAEKFQELHRSVLDCTPAGTVHHVIVAPRDKGLFQHYQSPRCRIWTTPELLPRRYFPVPANMHLNAARPWPPVRGWIMQQVVKIAAAAQVEADVALMADSDVVLVRPVEADRFAVDGQLCLFRQENGVTEDMERHVIWHRVAREIMGLPAAAPPPLPDYVSPLNIWDPAIVRAMQKHITETTGRDWLDVFASTLHISEFILYGVFVDEVRSRTHPRPATDTTICHNNWDREPLDLGAAIAFANELKPEAVAMMISAKSHTPEPIRRAAIARCREIVAAP